MFPYIDSSIAYFRAFSGGSLHGVTESSSSDFGALASLLRYRPTFLRRQSDLDKI